MATVNLGNIKFKWKGTYSGATAYTVDDVVLYNGSSYICILASTGNLPTNATYFEQMSAKGTDGINGTDLTSTLTTQGDLVYRDGSGLQRLGAGTAGQFLKTQGAGANPTWGTVTSKLLGHKITQYQQRLNLGNRDDNSAEISGLANNYGTPVSSNSYFVVNFGVSIAHLANHPRAYIEYSTDGGSTWNYDWTVGTLSGTYYTTVNDDRYKYPHLAMGYEDADSNKAETWTTTVLYQPTTPHSISNFRVRVMAFSGGSDNIIINSTSGTSTSYANVNLSYCEIIEYQE